MRGGVAPRRARLRGDRFRAGAHPRARAAGFTLVEHGHVGRATAFVAEWRQGDEGPKIGFLLEYDALPGLGNAAVPRREERADGVRNGHGCGHNLLGAALTGAAIAAKGKMLAERHSRHAARVRLRRGGGRRREGLHGPGRPLRRPRRCAALASRCRMPPCSTSGWRRRRSSDWSSMGEAPMPASIRGAGAARCTRSSSPPMGSTPCASTSSRRPGSTTSSSTAVAPRTSCPTTRG